MKFSAASHIVFKTIAVANLCLSILPALHTTLHAQPNDIRFDHISVEQGLSNFSITAIVQDQQGFLWIGTEDGLNKYDGYEFTIYKSDSADAHSLPNSFITCLYVDREGYLWIGTSGGLCRYNPALRGQFERFNHDSHNSESLSDKNVTAILEDSKGTLWIGTNAGLYRYDRQKEVLIHYRHDPNETTSINGDYIRALCEDRTGTIWIGANGINRYDREKNAFIHYGHDPNNPFNHVDDDVFCIREDRRGLIWFGALAGLYRYDRQRDTIVRCRHALRDPHTSAPEMICNLCEDSKGMLWVGTFHLGLWRYEATTDRFFHYGHDPSNPSSLSRGRISCIYEDPASRDVLWIGAYQGGLNRYDRQQDAFTRYKIDEEVYAISQDRRGNLWLGADGAGVLEYDRQGKRIAQYRHNPKIEEQHEVKAVYEDGKGQIWIGTNGNGLCRMDRAKKTFTYYKDREGLPDNFVKAILPDAHGNLWLGTGKGLSEFDPQTGTFKNFTVRDGLISNVLLSGACSKSHDGRLFFGGENGCIAFYPDSLKANPHIPPVVMTSFKVFDQPFAVPALQEIQLSYRQNFFSFEFAALDYTNPAKNQYAYKLEGFDKNWVYSGTKRNASYTDVDPGHYVFRVKGSNNDGIWNEQGIAVRITITPPFWETWWFKGLLWTAIMVAVGGTIRYIEIRKLRQRLRALEQQQALERERRRISQDMHDEVGTSLTEIVILSELAKKEVDKSKEAETHIQKISERAREVIDNIGEIIWATNPKNDRLDDLAPYLRHYAGRYFMMTSIKYCCEFPDTMPDIHLSAEARRNLFLVFKEALHNIVKHAAATEVVLRLACTPQRLEILIADNGKGISPDKGCSPENSSHFGNGLHNMKKRVENIGGTFTLQSQPNCGTQISIVVDLSLPVS